MNNRLRKAAILVHALEPPQADALLDCLGTESAARLRNAIMDLGQLTDVEEAAVIREFLDTTTATVTVPRRTAAGVVRAMESSAEAAAGPAPPFRSLQDASPLALARFLRREHPQTAAVVVSHLPPERAAEVLAQFSAEVQSDILHRVAELDETDPAVIREVEQGIESLLTEQLPRPERRFSGADAVRAILEASDRSRRDHVISDLSSRNGNLADQLREPAQPTILPFSTAAAAQPSDAPAPRHNAPSAWLTRFSQLGQLDDPTLKSLAAAADPPLVTLALTGASSELAARWLGQLPPRSAKQLRKQLRQQGPVRLSDIEQAQQELLGLAQWILQSSADPADPPKRRSAA